MTGREPFVHAVSNPSVRRDIAQSVRDGIDPEQLAAEFNIAPSTVHRYAAEWEGTQRRIAALQPDEVEAIRSGVARGARSRFERQYGAEVVRQVLGG
ncbi:MULTISPECIES: transposase family protein [unclassified Mycolicibacterium]|uniref:transposase family protein n=1 Tax=unclassified Mycolicibacterium TaxID=2636767 RepID=UPI001309EC3D|nr:MULTISPECIES: transposase family protein [unclassified Mycolicibacterium]MUL84330.1 transposase family protein [Mycolicibacterium sp. CBMA 329]MUL89604.1 transposase family protein [Mycolicibacterium sp. CBMA 331]MUL99780.1 transposase family protein [Mycolicibacterium sp. CBMA 334]MUM29581.1 transposase family protein [Mycolicibacterium sp. CBMA 295]MUM39119.1 transposase family protein [Mycolicibacterium sp. CBMA 247]